MEEILHSPDARCAVNESQKFPPLATINRPAVDTASAAFYLNRRPQTLRQWAMRDGYGPIRPLRINGRLAWPVAELRRLLGLVR